MPKIGHFTTATFCPKICYRVFKYPILEKNKVRRWKLYLKNTLFLVRYKFYLEKNLVKDTKNQVRRFGVSGQVIKNNLKNRTFKWK